MSSFSTTFCLLLLVVVVMFIINPSFVTPSKTQAVSNLVSQVCPETRDPGFCFKLFASDPRGGNPAVAVLGQIPCEKGIDTANAALGKITDLIKKTTDVQLIARYHSCADSYQDAIFSLKEAIKCFLLVVIDLRCANNEVSNVDADVRSCEGLFIPGKSGLTYYNHNLGLLSEIAAVLSSSK